MTHAIAAEAQALLEGVPLPASRQDLLDYARRQGGGPRLWAALHALPRREYRSLDDVGEELAPVQPERRRREPHEPRSESGVPPGGGDYTTVRPSDTGRVRDLDAATS